MFSKIAKVLVSAVLLRVLVGLLPHSGENQPPIGGDYEAQRHWMEVSLHLPIREWYSQTANNDLMYWGLDYPPLSAYVSYGIGYFAPSSLVRFRNSTLAAARIAALSHTPYVDGDEYVINTSKGGTVQRSLFNLSRHKWFMRFSVIVSDLLVYLPATFLLVHVTHLLGGFNGDSTSYDRSLFSWILLPPLLFIDHGHFQYNGIMLGLTMASAALLGQDRFLLSAALFSLALNFKQMALYFAPVFFVAILSASLSGYVQFLIFGNSNRSTHHPTLFQSSLAVLGVGAVVISIFGIMWSPFCLFATPGGFETLTVDSCILGMSVVLRRIFPFARNIFEDKVANIWCALEPALGFRKRLLAIPQETPRVALISAITTLLLIAPSLFFLFMMKKIRNNTAMVTDSTDVNLPSDHRSYTSSHLVTSRVMTKRKSSVSRAVSKAKSYSYRRRSNLKDNQILNSHQVDNATETNIGNVDVAVTPMQEVIVTNSIKESKRTLSHHSASVSYFPSSFDCYHSPLRMFESFLLSLFACSISFFLASFQVHEKSILLPLIPLHALHHKLPLLSLWFTSMSFFSLWPLFVKDGVLSVIMIVIVVVFFTNALSYPRIQIENSFVPWYRAQSKPPFIFCEEASSIIFVIERLFGAKVSRAMTVITVQSLLFRFVITMVIASMALGSAAFLLPAPLTKPDLYPYLTALFSAVNFGAMYVISITVQYKWLVLTS